MIYIFLTSTARIQMRSLIRILLIYLLKWIQDKTIDQHVLVANLFFYLHFLAVKSHFTVSLRQNWRGRGFQRWTWFLLDEPWPSCIHPRWSSSLTISFIRTESSSIDWQIRFCRAKKHNKTELIYVIVIFVWKFVADTCTREQRFT